MERIFITVTVIVILLMVCFSQSVNAQSETVDRIAVVVGDEVILASEVANQMQLVAFQTGQSPTTEEEVRELQNRVLEQMISDRLFLIEAKKDTSIIVRNDEVDREVDDQIARIATNFSSETEFLQALVTEGLSLRDLERRYAEEIENNMLRQRFIQKKLYSVSVSRYEVEQFCDKFQDSIPEQPEGVRLAHILLKIQPAEALEDSVKSLAAELRQRILDGADFATLATQYSSFGAGANGGDLGYVKRDDVVPEFARAAFQLDIGDISGVVQTQFGCHIITCEGKRGDKLRLRHILLGVVPDGTDTTRTMAVADSLIMEVKAGGDFAEMAKAFSTDDDSRAEGGELGWFAVEQLPDDFTTTVAGWKIPDEVRGPLLTRFGVHILKLLDYQPAKKLTLEEDFDRLKELARQDKTGRIVDEWIAEIKEKTFVEYRLEESN
ncbi:MAG: hypothetical protein DRP45_04370 [Candidatus Zixiibacteriota bacterium]|nr:MAG: hypothetical protein DRP45_04370 [candidate division Zixibacteria bacterium]